MRRPSFFEGVVVALIVSVIAAAVFLLLPEALRKRLLPHAVSFAIGALLGAALLGLLPHALEALGGNNFHNITGTLLLQDKTGSEASISRLPSRFME